MWGAHLRLIQQLSHQIYISILMRNRSQKNLRYDIWIIREQLLQTTTESWRWLDSIFSSTSWQKITRPCFLVPDVGYCSISSSSSDSYKYAPTDLSPSRLREFLWIGLKSDYFDFLILVWVIHSIVKLIHLTFLHPTSPPSHGWWLWMFVIFCSYTQNTVSGKI